MIFEQRKIRPGKVPTEVPLDETGVEFNEEKSDRIVRMFATKLT